MKASVTAPPNSLEKDGDMRRSRSSFTRLYLSPCTTVKHPISFSHLQNRSLELPEMTGEGKLLSWLHAGKIKISSPAHCPHIGTK